MKTESLTNFEEMSLTKKLFWIYSQISTIPKSDKGGKYKYVSSSDVLNKVRDLMIQARIMLIPYIASGSYEKIVTKDGQSATILTELDILYKWVNVDDETQFLEIPFYGQGVDISGEKGVGKALTYAEKYFLLKFFNIPTDEADPDHSLNQSGGYKMTPTDKLKNPAPEEDAKYFSDLNTCHTLSRLNSYYAETKNYVSDRDAYNKAYVSRAKELKEALTTSKTTK